MDLTKRNDIPIEIWIMRNDNNNDLGFDERKYHRQQEFIKQNNANAQQIRHVIQLQRSMAYNFGHAFKKNTDHKPNKQINGQSSSNGRKFKNGRSKFKTVLYSLTKIVQKYEKNAKWDSNFCLFWNSPNEECKNGDQCQRHHKCPLCSSTAHKIGECSKRPPIQINGSVNLNDQ